MPINYKNYPPEWKTVIRPAILKRAGDKCEFCGVENKKWIFRCKWDGYECYQDSDGGLFFAENSKKIDNNTEFWDLEPLGKDKAIKVVLIIAHLDHDVTNNDYSNLKALCQRCHLRHDAKFHSSNRKNNKNNKEKSLKLF